MLAPLLSLLTSSGGLGMLALLGAAIWILMDVQDRLRPRVFLFIAAIPVYGFFCERVLRMESAWLPLKYDFWLYRVDEALGLSALSIARTLHVGPTISLLSEVYRTILIAMAFGYGSSLKRGKGPSIFPAYVAELLVGPCLYALLPACGPYYAFPNFPWNPFNPPVAMVALSGAPNAVPSLHMSNAFLLLMFARTSPGRCLAGLFALATAVATLTTGEHYVIDLIVGLPFACFAAAVAQRNLRAAVGYLGAVLAWMIALRTAGPGIAAHPNLLQLFVLATLTIAGFATVTFWKAARGGADEGGHSLSPNEAAAAVQ